MNIRAAAFALVVLTVPGMALAQPTQQGVRDGTAAGGAVGGPVGAAVGGAVGGAVGLGLEIPNAVLGGLAPRPSVAYERAIVVGQPLPSEIEYYEVPGHAEYRYTVVNNKRYIVESKSRRVIRVVE